jgi:hypothetical protein
MIGNSAFCLDGIGHSAQTGAQKNGDLWSEGRFCFDTSKDGLQAIPFSANDRFLTAQRVWVLGARTMTTETADPEDAPRPTSWQENQFSGMDGMNGMNNQRGDFYGSSYF